MGWLCLPFCCSAIAFQGIVVLMGRETSAQTSKAFLLLVFPTVRFLFADSRYIMSTEHQVDEVCARVMQSVILRNEESRRARRKVPSC